MNRFRLTISTTLVGVLLATGCASPCGSCRDGIFHRISMFRARRTACPCECCSSCGGGVAVVGASPDACDGPILEPPGPPLPTIPSLPSLPPPAEAPVPEPLPNLGAPLGTPAVPAEPGRLNPVPNGAQPYPAGPSSRVRRR